MKSPVTGFQLLALLLAVAVLLFAVRRIFVSRIFLLLVLVLTWTGLVLAIVVRHFHSPNLGLGLTRDRKVPNQQVQSVIVPMFLMEFLMA